jgi:hypothetical protein
MRDDQRDSERGDDPRETDQTAPETGTTETRPIMDGDTTVLHQDTQPNTRPARGSTITWGMILLVIAALYGAGLLIDIDLVDPVLALAWGITGLGVVVVLVGLIAAATRRRD